MKIMGCLYKSCVSVYESHMNYFWKCTDAIFGCNEKSFININ